MKCNHNHIHEIETEEDRIALVYGETIVLATLSFLGYDDDRSGCFVLSDVDHTSINIIPNENMDNIQIMVFDSFSVSLTIDKVSIYDKDFSKPMDLNDLTTNKCYQFSTTGLKKENESTDGMIRNPITGKWSFL